MVSSGVSEIFDSRSCKALMTCSSSSLLAGNPTELRNLFASGSCAAAGRHPLDMEMISDLTPSSPVTSFKDISMKLAFAYSTVIVSIGSNFAMLCFTPFV